MTDERVLQEIMRTELRKVAPGTRLREALDMIISARMGALVVVGDADEVEPLCNDGFVLNVTFTPQRLFELSKMDGAIVLDAECDHIVRANTHLVPDPALLTCETGMRHRTAERLSRQSNALAIAISGRRNTVSLYLLGRRIQLEDIEVLLAKANQAIQTLQNYRQRLDEMLERLTLLEFEDLVTLGDITEVVSRFEMLLRVSREVSRYIIQLGTEGRLVRMQSDEFTSGVMEQYTLVLRDYSDSPRTRRVNSIRDRLAGLPSERLLEPEVIAHELGLTSAEQAEQHLRSRGHRALAQIPMLPGTVVGRIVERFGTLPAIVRASTAELDAVDGVGERRARSIANGLARVKAHVSV
ncbi:MAG: DNA integrity scanning diadenylate cyclase DisA [Coriobacteriia bacterium]|nr:DNA integrity scanning diadenylate cyclase DisA [Coriobacteriia bacterium]